MGYLRLLYRIPWLLLHIFVGTPVVVLGHCRPFKDMRVGEHTLQHVVAVRWSRSVCRIFGLRIDARGEVKAGPQLIVANHISWIDITAMHSIASMGFVSKAEIRDWPVIGFLARVGGTVFHQRGCSDSSSGVAHQMGERLRDGGNVAIFPEGGIRPGEGVKRFHGRLFAAAIETESPVQPMMLRYLRDGDYDHDMTFLAGEHFVSNFFRLLRQAPAIAHIEVLPRLDSAGKQRRALAAEAEASVRQAFEADIPGA